MTKITALSFIKCFERFLVKKRSAILKNYQDKKARTESIIGKRGSRNEDSPLGDYIRKEFTDYSYRKEDGGVDISVYKKSSKYKGIKNMWFNDPRDGDLELENIPAYYDLLIELENNTQTGYEEMMKLTYYNSHMKVLILQLWEPDRWGDSYVWAHDRQRDNFQSIIGQANKRYCENAENQYILITLQLVNNRLCYQASIMYVDGIVNNNGTINKTLNLVVT